MIQLVSKNLPNDVQEELDKLQVRINKESTFLEKVKKAQSLWKSKGGGSGQKAIKSVREALKELCVFKCVCNYCEQNEASDIEHIDPKSLFPEFTFIWENYLLVCKSCNSEYKSDKCYVLDENDNLIEVKRGEEPLNKTTTIINPRKDDPNKFMIINTLINKFDILPGLSKRDKNKADTTLLILKLNERDTLVEARKSAGRHYFEMLDRLRKILLAKNIDELENALTPFDDYFDLTKPLKDLKSEIKASYKTYISTYQHPSVWYSIKLIDSKYTRKWIELFKDIPEALNW